MTDHEEMRVAEFAFPGALRERLVRAILDGAKTATAGLLLEYELDPSEVFPVVGERSAVIDSEGRRVAVIKTESRSSARPTSTWRSPSTRARASSRSPTGVPHTCASGSDAMRALLGLPDFRLTDDTMVVAERFQMIERLV